MLKVWVKGFNGNCKKAPDVFFNIAKKSEWFSDKIVQDIIYEIDNTMVIDGEYLLSPVLGGMSPDRLSTGCKCLILMYMYPNCNVYASRCGDNCANRILDLSKNKDVVITLHHCMKFPKDRDFDICFLDSGVVTHNYKDYVNGFFRLLEM